MEIWFDDSCGVVRCRVDGAWTAERADAALGRVAALVATHDDAVGTLLDVRSATRATSTVDVYQQVSRFPALFSPRQRHAVLTPIDLSADPDARFTTTVGANRGVQIRFFTDEAWALDWLLRRA